MQPELKERLEQAASEAGRSLNAEIIARLDASFSDEAGLSDVDKKFLLLLVKELKTKNQMDLFPAADESAPSDAVAALPEPPKRPKRIIRKKSDS